MGAHSTRVERLRHVNRHSCKACRTVARRSTHDDLQQRTPRTHDTHLVHAHVHAVARLLHLIHVRSPAGPSGPLVQLELDLGAGELQRARRRAARLENLGQAQQVAQAWRAAGVSMRVQGSRHAVVCTRFAQARVQLAGTSHADAAARPTRAAASPTETSSLAAASSIRSCACLYVSAARLAMTDLVKRVDTTCVCVVFVCVCVRACGDTHRTHRTQAQAALQRGC